MERKELGAVVVWAGSSLSEVARERDEGVEMGEAELDVGDEAGEKESEEMEDWEEER